MRGPGDENGFLVDVALIKRNVRGTLFFREALAAFGENVRLLREQKEEPPGVRATCLNPAKVGGAHDAKEGKDALLLAGPALSTNGSQYKKEGSQAQKEWRKKLMDQNAAFVKEFLDGARGADYKWGRRRRAAVQPGGAGSLFSLADVQHRIDGGNAREHCDGGASVLMACLTLSGARRIEIVAADGAREVLHLQEGDFYVTSPACFWCILFLT